MSVQTDWQWRKSLRICFWAAIRWPHAHFPLQVPEMPATGQDRRRSELAGSKGRKRELFKEEDVKLQWATVRKAVSSSSSSSSKPSRIASICVTWRWIVSCDLP